MGNGARAQQKRERNAKDAKKAPSSQLKSVGHPQVASLPHWMTVWIGTERGRSNSHLQDMPTDFSKHYQPEGAGSARGGQTWEEV
jgi:hypothetical protein